MIFQKDACKSNLILTSLEPTRTIILPYQRRLTSSNASSLRWHRSYMYVLYLLIYCLFWTNVKATMVDTIYRTFICLISPNVHFTLTLFSFFLEIIWSAVNRCLYSIDPVHFMLRDNRLSRAPWSYPISPHFQPDSSH